MVGADERNLRNMSSRMAKNVLSFMSFHEILSMLRGDGVLLCVVLLLQLLNL